MAGALMIDFARVVRSSTKVEEQKTAFVVAAMLECVSARISHGGNASFFRFRFLFRLYWYPLKVLYSTGVVTAHRAYDRGCGLYGFFNSLLWILLGLNIYWLVVRPLTTVIVVVHSVSRSSLFFNFSFDCFLATNEISKTHARMKTMTMMTQRTFSRQLDKLVECQEDY